MQTTANETNRLVKSLEAIRVNLLRLDLLRLRSSIVGSGPFLPPPAIPERWAWPAGLCGQYPLHLLGLLVVVSMDLVNGCGHISCCYLTRNPVVLEGEKR